MFPPLVVRIGGKVDIIEQYEEEGDLFKDKNYHLKEKVCFFSSILGFLESCCTHAIA